MRTTQTCTTCHYIEVPEKTAGPMQVVDAAALWEVSSSPKGGWRCRTWVAGAAARPVWDSIYAPNAVDRVAASGAGKVSETAVRYTPRQEAMVHGGLGKMLVPWHDGVADIRSLYVSARHCLVVKGVTEPDDSAIANVGLQVGLDYYPWMKAKLADLEAAYVPGAGSGRFLRVTSDWRYSSLVLRKSAVQEGELMAISPPGFKY